MTVHEIPLQASTVHGCFSESLSPAVTIASGDTVVARTVDVTWGIEQHGAPGTPRARFVPDDVETRHPERDRGPAMIGPVAVAGAEPGMTLEVRIIELRPASWGWTAAGPGPFNCELNEAIGVLDTEWTTVRWSLDADRGTAVSEHGDHRKLDPFLGTIGLCPGGDDPAAWHCGWTPYRTGGNMDCSALTVGASLFFPVEVDGALLSFGDGHALQSDGESSGSAIECPFDRVELECHLHPDLTIRGPRAITAEGRVTLGFGASLDEALVEALGAMLDWRETESGRPRAELLALSSSDVDLRVTQVVNPRKGVHAVWRTASASAIA